MNEQQQFWIALLTAVGATLGIKEYIIPAIIKWWQDRTAYRRNKKTATVEQITKLNDRINILEKELDRHRAFETQTRATLNAMLPLMKEMMREHPDYVKLLDQLERNIIGATVSADGENNRI